MKTVNNQQFNETYIEDYCDNGLHVVVWHKPDFATSSCLFGTPYGSLDIQQILSDGTLEIFPSGIAHFLEHKLFESDEGDIMTKFANLGASVNAFTSFRETVYYFNTTNSDLFTPLNLLLDFVQNLQITQASVEKEKGIIGQELDMYLEMPDSRLFFETLKSLYHNHPLRIDIGGTHEDVFATTKENLEHCHRINYHPSNMHVVIVTPHDPQSVIDEIKRNQANKEFCSFTPPMRKLDDEPTSVYEKEKVLHMSVQQTKTCIGVKLPVYNLDPLLQAKKEWTIRFILEAHFSTINPQYQDWINQKNISYYFGFDENITSDSCFLTFYDEGIDPDKLTKFINSQWNSLKEFDLSQDQLTQLKNRSFGETLNLFNNPSTIGIQYFRSLHQKVSLFDLLNIIHSITLEDCKDAVHELEFSNYCRVIIKPNS